MTKTLTLTNQTDRFVGNFPVVHIDGFDDNLLFPDVQSLWSFQAAQSYRDEANSSWDSGELSSGEAAYNFLRDEFGYDADEIMDWVACGEVAHLTPSNAVIVGAR